MATPWSEINEKFFDLIEQDGTFFRYYNLTDAESSALAIQRANSLLKEAAVRIMMECECEIDFTDWYEDELGEMLFTADLTEAEKDLLANLQYEAYLKRDVAKLKVFQQKYTPNDLQVFSPANDRKTFMAMYETVCEENKTRLDRYKSKSRSGFKTKYISYESYDAEDE